MFECLVCIAFRMMTAFKNGTIGVRLNKDLYALMDPSVRQSSPVRVAACVTLSARVVFENGIKMLQKLKRCLIIFFIIISIKTNQLTCHLVYSFSLILNANAR